MGESAWGFRDRDVIRALLVVIVGLLVWILSPILDTRQRQETATEVQLIRQNVQSISEGLREIRETENDHERRLREVELRQAQQQDGHK